MIGSWLAQLPVIFAQGVTVKPPASPEKEEGSTGDAAPSWLVDQWNALGQGMQTVVALIAFLAVFFLFRRMIIRRLERAAAKTENDLDDRVVHIVKQFYGIGMFFLIVLWVLRIWNIEVSPLLAGAGIVGISLGFAAKEFLADIFAGVFLITDRPMTVGDRVNIERIGSDWGSWGDVVDIGLRRTQIRNTDGVVVNYPNAALSNSVITNFSHEEHPVRVRLRFAVSLEADLEQAMQVTKGVVSKCDGVLPDSTDVIVRSIWDQSRGVLLAGALLEVRYRIADIRARSRIRSAVLVQIVAALKEAGVSMPSAAISVDSPSAS